MKSVKFSRTITLNSQTSSLKQKLLIFGFFCIFIILFFIVSISMILNSQNFNTDGYEIYAGFIGLVLEIITFVYYIKKHKRIKAELTDFVTLDYISEFPSDHKPAIISYLMQDENSDDSDITATLLDLVQRKLLLIEQEFRIEDLLNDKVNIRLTINPNIDINTELCDYEKYLVNWFFDELNKSNELKTSELRQKLINDSKSGQKFLEWQSLVAREYNNYNFMINKNNKNVPLLIFFACILLLMLPVHLSITFEILLFFITQCIAIKISFDGFNNRILSSNGKELIRKWNGFINFIKTHSTIEQHNILSVALYEKYVVYSVALNSADKIITDMQKNYGWQLYKFNQ